jgi:hypothetical protein
MANRPRWTDRDTLFRPFSSWDDHVLLQLKRTKEVAIGRQVNRLLKYALRPGKAARNPQLVPDLHLLQEYGTGDSSKYLTKPPRELLQQVTLAAIQQAIEPLLVEECFLVIQAKPWLIAISSLRQQAEALAIDPVKFKFVRQQLHQPTLELRQGEVNKNNTSIIDKTLKEFGKELEALRP